MPLFTPTSSGSTCTIRVTPRAGRTALAGIRDDLLLVKLAAAPVDDAANDALVAYLAETFDIPRRHIRIASGHRSRTKRVIFEGATPAALEARLAQHSP